MLILLKLSAVMVIKWIMMQTDVLGMTISKPMHSIAPLSLRDVGNLYIVPSNVNSRMKTVKVLSVQLLFLLVKKKKSQFIKLQFFFLNGN